MDLRERTGNPNRHPWELSRADRVLGLLGAKPRSTRYADVGAGDLYFARRLRELSDAPVCAVDVNFVDQSAEPGLAICTDLNQVASCSIDCAVLMDVLEHVDDDVALARAITRVLAPGGELLVTVPAHAFLWSGHDVFLGHRRRYQRRQLSTVLEQGGFTVVESFYFYTIPYLARAAGVALARALGREDVSSATAAWPYPPCHAITRMVRAVLNGDFALSRRIGTWSGLGLSICAICRRTSA